jgi:hypothetical protein
VIYKVGRLIASFVFVLGLLVVFGATASAATVTIQDDAGMLSSSDENSLRNKALKFPYNVTLFTSNYYKDDTAFTNEVNARLNRMAANSIIIGVSGNLKITRVSAKNIGVSSPEATEISQAANSFFQAGNYSAGFNATLDRTNQLSKITAPLSTKPTAISSISSNSTAFRVGFVFGIVGILTLWLSGIIR